MTRSYVIIAIVLLWFGLSPNLLAAVRHVLTKNDVAVQAFMTQAAGIAAQQQVSFRELNRVSDFRQMLHVRLQQTYAGYPIFGASSILHFPQVNDKSTKLASLWHHKSHTINGVIYERLQEDLQGVPVDVFQTKQAEFALNAMIKHYQNSHGSQTNISNKKANLLVFVDKNNKAHWVYCISFYVSALEKAVPEQPVYLIDALSFHIYKAWNGVKTVSTANSQLVFGGGYGGNIRIGKIHYDGWSLPEHQIKLRLMRDIQQQCYFKNEHVTIFDHRDNKIVNYYCPQQDEDHNHVYWNDYFGAANGGFSSSNDTMFALQMVYDMYAQWYNVSIFKEVERSNDVKIVVHLPKANAYWDGITRRAYFGDGSQSMFPLTTIDVIGHEISHGFTQFHSNLEYVGESGGINESFSDMAGATLNYYITKSLNWQIGRGVFKTTSQPLRWMDTPSKDGASIENVQDYFEGIDVHYSSGIFNKAFYLLSTTPGWDIKKAFALMVHANRFYWTSTSGFQEGACGVIAAARDLLYPVANVSAAFRRVGINTNAC